MKGLEDRIKSSSSADKKQSLEEFQSNLKYAFALFLEGKSILMSMLF